TAPGKHLQGVHSEDSEPFGPHRGQRAVEGENQGAGEVQRQQQRSFGGHGPRYTPPVPAPCRYRVAIAEHQDRFIACRRDSAQRVVDDTGSSPRTWEWGDRATRL